MSAALVSPPLDNDPELRRKRFTRLEVNRMLETGIFVGQRFELIDGELIDKMGQGPSHAYAVQLLTKLLAGAFGLDSIRVQLPIEAGGPDRQWNQPEPDLAVVSTPGAHFRKRHPHGQELLLVVEVADSSWRQDAFRKRDIYAAAGVPEYWVVNLDSNQVLIHRQLTSGKYAEVLTLAATSELPYIHVALATVFVDD